MAAETLLSRITRAVSLPVIPGSVACQALQLRRQLGGAFRIGRVIPDLLSGPGIEPLLAVESPLEAYLFTRFRLDDRDIVLRFPDAGNGVALGLQESDDIAMALDPPGIGLAAHIFRDAFDNLMP
jgi:hypothetical protein